MQSKNKNKKTTIILIVFVLIIGISVVSWYYFGYIKAFCPYDVNRDGKIGAEDLSVVLSKIGEKCIVCWGDVNRDRIVNEIDVQLIEENYRKSCK